MAETDTPGGTPPSTNEDARPAAGPRRITIGNARDGGIAYWTGKLYGFAALVLVTAIGVAGFCTYASFAKEAPPPPDLSRYADVVPGISRMVAADGTLLGEFATEWRELTPYEDIPQRVIDAFLAAEDHQFFEHNGIYFKGILRAAWRNLTAGDFAQGGSTITQQVAKQFLSSKKTLTRKAKEAIMARRLEATYSKEAILSVYLNHIYLGNGAYGVTAAAKRYFDKKLEELTVAEAALIAGLAQAPSRYSPTANPELAKERRNDILDKMARHGFLDEATAEEAKAAPIELDVKQDVFGRVSPYYAEHLRRYVVDEYGADALFEGGLRIEAAVAPVTDRIAYENVDFGARKQDKRQGWRGAVAYLDAGKPREIFLRRAAEFYGDGPLEEDRRYLALVTEVGRRGATVQIGEKTYELPLDNMDWASEWSAREPINDVPITDARAALEVGHVVWVSRKEILDEEFEDWFLAGGINPRWRHPVPEERLDHARETVAGEVVLEQVPHPQAAIFTADHRTGYVVAMVGGTDFDRSVYNRAIQACRQPGSTYKPIYYSTALDMGYGFDTALNDVPHAEIDPVTGEVWLPENFGGANDYEVSLEYALTFSKNLPSVDVFKKVGTENFEAWVKRLGITTKIVPDDCYDKTCTALALGAMCVYLDELTRAFALFARNGTWVDWVYARRILDRDGNVLEDNTVPYDPHLAPADRLDRVFATAGQTQRQAIPARTAFLTTKLMRKVITHGFSAVVRQAGINAAAKTGTSSATMDTLVVGFTSRWVSTVWLGDDLRERPLGKDDAAYMTVVPMWARYMAAATRGHPNLEVPWEVPDGVDPRDRGGTRGEQIHMPLQYRRKAKPEDLEAAGIEVPPDL